MPLFSCFTPFGMLEFSSEPSEAEKIYMSIVRAYRDPNSGKVTIDTTPGTQKEAVIYGWAMAIGGARINLRRAGNELRPETSYTQLTAQEDRFQVSPASDDSVVMRRAALAAKQKAARGPRFEAVWEALSVILGDNLVAYRPITTSEAVAYPADPNVATTPGIFRRNDAIPQSVRILTAITRMSDTEFVCDEYDEVNQDTATQLNDVYSAVGQTFTGNGGAVSTVRFNLQKEGAPTGNAFARIYKHTGTFGTSGLPTGNPLASSEPVDVSTLPLGLGAFALIDFNFVGPNRIDLELGTKYVLVLEYKDGTATDWVDVGADAATLTHPGNYVIFTIASGKWTAYTVFETIFHLLTTRVMEVTYENWNRSLVETVLVPGDIVCVDPGNWGLAERVLVLASSGPGTLRTFTAAFLKPHSAGVYGTTGPTPLWSNTKRHVLVVVKAAAAVDPAIVRRINELFRRLMRGPTTWAIVQPTTPGAGTVGPFAIGDTLGSPLGAVPVESITL